MKAIIIVLIFYMLLGLSLWGGHIYIHCTNGINTLQHDIWINTALVIIPIITGINILLIFNKKIKELRIIEQEFNRSHSKYCFIFNAAPFYINLVDSNGIIIDSNDMSKELLGYTREELIGDHYSKIIHPDFLYQAQKEMDILLKGKEIGKWFSHYKMIKKGGEEIDVQARTTSLFNEKGNFVHTICFIMDMSERLKFEKDVLELTDELKHSNQELEQFAYVASHDLQEPLRVVSSYCQMLEEKYKEYHTDIDEEIEKWFSYISEATTRMKCLIKELLDFSRVGRKDKPYENIDLNGLINEVKKDFAITIQETKAEIIVEHMPSIFAIRFRIYQLFHNLISNSLKFRSTDPPNINISFCDEGEMWLFCVKDNGLGIDSSHYDRVFGLFKRLYSREEYPGSGIGLALCKKIIEIHRGNIWVDSEVGKGSSFYFSLPKEKKIQ